MSERIERALDRTEGEVKELKQMVQDLHTLLDSILKRMDREEVEFKKQQS